MSVLSFSTRFNTGRLLLDEAGTPYLVRALGVLHTITDYLLTS